VTPQTETDVTNINFWSPLHNSPFGAKKRKKEQIASRFVKFIKKNVKNHKKNQNFGLSKIRNTLYSCFAAGSPPQAENFVVLRFINAVFLRKLSNFEGF